MLWDMLRTSKALGKEHLKVIKQSESVGFYQKRYNLFIDFRWHLLYSYNTDFFALIFPTSSIVLMNTMQSLMTWYFPKSFEVCERIFITSHSTIGSIVRCLRDIEPVIDFHNGKLFLHGLFNDFGPIIKREIDFETPSGGVPIITVHRPKPFRGVLLPKGRHRSLT